MGTFTTPAMVLSVEPEVLADLAIKCLEETGTENTNDYRYLVCPQWFESWKKYTGQIKPFSPGAVKVPGPVQMNEEANNSVDGKLWRHLIYWYGLHPTHELNRQPMFKNGRYKQFSIGVMAPMVADAVKRKDKTFNVDDAVGYVECQLRQIFGVRQYRQSRLWVKKDPDGVFQLLANRFLSLTEAIIELDDNMDFSPYSDGKYLLNLEMLNPQGEWPTGYQTEVRGKLDLVYGEVTIGGQYYDYNNSSNAYMDISNTLMDTAAYENTGHQMQEMCDHLQAQVTELNKAGLNYEQAQWRLARELNLAREEMNKQTERKKNLNIKEKLIDEKEKSLDLKIQKFEKDQQEYENELNQAKKVNAITENRIRLNVGGKHYTTSLQTLTAIPDTYLSCLFSGKYPLTKDEDGSYFIDRDGANFYYILEYLRKRQIDVDHLIKVDEIATLKRIMVEADFYNLVDLYNDIRIALSLDYADLFDAFRNLAVLNDDIFNEL